jgi:hypothetical protein
MMETFVQEGMIVVLPRGGGCADVRASSNCRPMASVSASDAGRYLRVSASGQMERPLVSAEDLERLFGIRIGTDRGSSATPAPGLVFVAGVGADVAGSLNSRGMTHEAGLLETRSTAFAPETPVAAPQKLPEQLVWGRFSSAASLPMQLPVPYSQAAAGSHVTVGEIGQYALWRTGANGPLDRTLAGKVDFNLAAAEAVFQQASGLSRAEVQAARLGIDFDRSTFSAGVTLSHAATGQVAFGVDGRMSNEGVFWAGNAAERIAGAVSRDGSEAGFLFTKEHPAGTFRGVTLWNGR